jgi:hypothetical protein
MKVAEFLCRLTPSQLNWQTSALHTLSSLSLQRAYVKDPPDVIIMPRIIVVLRDKLWQKTQGGIPPKEWVASLITMDGRDIYCHSEEGSVNSAELMYIRADQLQQVGYVMSIHTHPIVLPPSLQDLCVTLSMRKDYVHPVCNLVVAGRHTFLLLRHCHGRGVSAWIYHSADRRTFRRLAGDDLQRIYALS